MSWTKSPFLSSNVQEIQRYYVLKSAIEGLDQEVEFAADRITLEVPVGGTTVEEGWAVKPLVHPTVRKLLPVLHAYCL